MKIMHLISGGDVGGAKTHVLSLLHALNRTEYAHLVCFTEGRHRQQRSMVLARSLGPPITCGPALLGRLSPYVCAHVPVCEWLCADATRGKSHTHMEIEDFCVSLRTS